MNHPQEYTEDYYNQHFEEYAETHHLPEFLDKEHEWLKFVLPEGGNVLEIGFGPGYDAAKLVQHFNYTGIDPAESWIKRAKKKSLKGRFIQSRVEDINFINQFDAVWAAASLLHLTVFNTLKALKKIRKALKPGGYGVVLLKKRIDDLPMERIDQDHLGKRTFTLWLPAEFLEALDLVDLDLYDCYEFISKSGKTTWIVFLIQKPSEP